LLLQPGPVAQRRLVSGSVMGRDFGGFHHLLNKCGLADLPGADKHLHKAPPFVEAL